MFLLELSRNSFHTAGLGKIPAWGWNQGERHLPENEEADYREEADHMLGA